MTQSKRTYLIFSSAAAAMHGSSVAKVIVDGKETEVEYTTNTPDEAATGYLWADKKVVWSGLEADYKYARVGRQDNSGQRITF